jgi:hypothetical protein
MGEIHVRDCEEFDADEIESVEIWSDYGIDEEVVIKLKDGSVKTVNCL